MSFLQAHRGGLGRMTVREVPFTREIVLSYAYPAFIIAVLGRSRRAVLPRKGVAVASAATFSRYPAHEHSLGRRN
jgi:hypothetical protein